jgi:hypothetical protein
LALALILLNNSADSPDPYHAGPENLTYNDIESVVEFILESCLDYENAITEHDDADNDDKSGPVKKIDYELAAFKIVHEKPEIIPVATDSGVRGMMLESAVSSGFDNEIAQPPEA